MTTCGGSSPQVSWWRVVVVPVHDGITVMHGFVWYRSLFYGYANGDIMFDEGLPKTLLEILDDVVDRYNELLITGVRTDCVVDADPDCDVVLKSSRSATLNELQTTNGNRSAETTRFFQRRTALDQHGRGTASGTPTTPLKNAQDYFITKRSGFPWSTIPDFVVGRAGVDNWLMVTALARRGAVVDASRTITARHQVRPGYKPSAHFTQPTGDANVNYALAGQWFDYSLGLTDCAPLETAPAPPTIAGHQQTYDCDRTIVLRRRQFNRYCWRAYVKLRGLHRPSRGTVNYRYHRNITNIN